MLGPGAVGASYWDPVLCRKALEVVVEGPAQGVRGGQAAGVIRRWSQQGGQMGWTDIYVCERGEHVSRSLGSSL